MKERNIARSALMITNHFYGIAQSVKRVAASWSRGRSVKGKNTLLSVRRCCVWTTWRTYAISYPASRWWRRSLCLIAQVHQLRLTIFEVKNAWSCNYIVHTHFTIPYCQFYLYFWTWLSGSRIRGLNATCLLKILLTIIFISHSLTSRGFLIILCKPLVSLSISHQRLGVANQRMHNHSKCVVGPNQRNEFWPDLFRYTVAPQ